MHDQKSNVSLARKNVSDRNLALFIASGHKKKGHINNYLRISDTSFVFKK